MAAVQITKEYGSTYLSVWNLTTADGTGEAIQSPGASDRAVQVSGSFGGATVLFEGSLDGTNWDTLHDPGGVAITFTAKGINAISENAAFIRARLSPAGTGATIKASLLSRSTR
jgi:hypothetical protein